MCVVAPALHLLQRGDAEETEKVTDHDSRGVEEGETRIAHIRIDVVAKCGALFIELVERLADLPNVGREPVRRDKVGRGLHLAGIVREPAE